MVIVDNSAVRHLNQDAPNIKQNSVRVDVDYQLLNVATVNVEIHLKKGVLITVPVAVPFI